MNLKNLSIKLSAVVGLCVALSGCFASTAINTLDLSVAGYCALSKETRELNRNAVALAVKPNAVKIDCAADAEEE